MKENALLWTGQKFWWCCTRWTSISWLQPQQQQQQNFSLCLLLQFTVTAIIIRFIAFRVGNDANVTSQLKLSLPVGLLFTFYVIVLICFFGRWQLSHLLLLQRRAVGVLWEARVRKERSVDFVSVSHLVQRQTATTAASQPTNGRMTTLLMNALIICVGGEVGVGGVYGFMTVFWCCSQTDAPLL